MAEKIMLVIVALMFFALALIFVLGHIPGVLDG